MLQQESLTDLIAALRMVGNKIEIETAGTILPTASWRSFVHFNVSPKLEHSGNDLRARRNPAALVRFALLGAQFKFVVATESDFVEIEALIEMANIPREQVWIMPEGTTTEATTKHARQIVDYVLSKGWNLTLRNQIIIWGNERAK